MNMFADDVKCMNEPVFDPGFRLSLFDVVVLVFGALAAFATGWIGLVIIFVVLHMFLFCNVCRIARSRELLWAAVFVLLAGYTILHNTPGWAATFVISTVMSGVLVFIEMRKPSYHGIGWRWINPRLPTWWKGRVAQG